MLDQPDKVADYNKRMDDTAKAVHDELAAYALPALDKERELAGARSWTATSPQTRRCATPWPPVMAHRPSRSPTSSRARRVATSSLQ